MNFKDKVVLITGGSGGIGSATAIQFAKQGAKIIINYYSSEEKAYHLLSKINKIGAEAIAIKCDISKEKKVAKMINKIIKKFGKIDVLVNNAGIVIDTPLLDRTVGQWQRVMEVNLLGIFLCSKYSALYMIKNRIGKIINISSTSALYSFSPEIIDYDISKAGVIALTKDFAKQLAPYNIQINSIAPGWVDTKINNSLSEAFIKKEKNAIYQKRFAKPVEIAKVILFLASNDASYITGSNIIVDGGHD